MSEDSIHSFKDAFGKFLKSQSLEHRFTEKKLIHSWGEIMGKPIANRTTKIFIKDRILHVKLTSAPLKQELTMASEKVLDLLEKALGERVVDDVRFL